MKSLNFALKPLRYWIDGITYRMLKANERLSALKDRHRGKPMLVVGNGPSLNKTPLEDFNAVPAIGMNKIDLLFSRSSWRPSIIMCANDAVVIQHRAVFADSDIPICLAWKARWFMPRKSKNVFYFLNEDSEQFSTKADSHISVGDTVTYSALQLAYWMGADPVIVFGVDHSFSQVGKPGQYKVWRGNDVNHFDPNYFKHGSLFGNPDLEGSERQYRNARLAFEADGRRILDATVDGQLNIFEKISVEHAKRLVDR